MVALFHVLEKEMDWRRARGQLEGFDCMKASKPLVAVGADHPLEDDILMADYFRKRQSNLQDLDAVTDTALDGIDGLAGVHTTVGRLSHPVLKMLNRTASSSLPLGYMEDFVSTSTSKRHLTGGG